MSKNPKVLVACEESQRVCTAFREIGIEAYSADIQEPSGGHSEWHIQGDVLNVLSGHVGFITKDNVYHFVEKWDLIIAHPPCTYLSNAGACRLYPQKGVLNMERYAKGLEGKEFFMKFINADCERVCVENPIPSRIFELPPYTQVIQPYQYGHPYSKKTCLWLKNLPPLVPTDIVTEFSPFLPSGTGRKNRDKYGAEECEKGKDRQKNRAKTFPGIAKAMAEQWGNELIKK